MHDDPNAYRSAPTDAEDAGNFSVVLPTWRQANTRWARASDTTTLHMRRSAMLSGLPALADWIVAAPRREGACFMDWRAVSFDDALGVTLRVFAAARVPPDVRAEVERHARITRLTDECKTAYQQYLDELGASRRGYPAIERSLPVTGRRGALDLARVRALVEKVRGVSAFHCEPPSLIGLPAALVPGRVVFETFGDVEDGVRLDVICALDVDTSRAILDAAIPYVPLLDDWLAAPSARSRPELFAAALATRAGVEHLAVRLRLLDGIDEVNGILERVDDDGKLPAAADARLLSTVDSARAGAVLWALDARDIGMKLAPQCDDFAPMINDVFDADTVNGLLLFKAERSLGHRRLVADSVTSELASLLPYAELLDVGGDVGTHVVASLALTARSRDRLRALAEPMRSALDDFVWSAWIDGPPQRPEWLAMFALNNVLNHLDAPEETRREHEHLFAQVAGS